MKAKEDIVTGRRRRGVAANGDGGKRRGVNAVAVEME